MQEVTLAFKFSAKRLLVFKEQHGDNPVAREEMGRRSKLKVKIDTLDQLSEEGDCKARALHASILNGTSLLLLLCFSIFLNIQTSCRYTLK
ncbi:unnamed protein product [Pocillopora meandrina]|uniref:Uncharacterized protein n=1 Tax=Pocillopora meandrina TaxID=46732 RepID=A0AAU9WKW5_9CNID|nr:unnamed protein product [Pocillopora meandrina]